MAIAAQFAPAMATQTVCSNPQLACIPMHTHPHLPHPLNPCPPMQVSFSIDGIFIGGSSSCPSDSNHPRLALAALYVLPKDALYAGGRMVVEALVGCLVNAWVSSPLALLILRGTISNNLLAKLCASVFAICDTHCMQSPQKTKTRPQRSLQRCTSPVTPGTGPLPRMS